ncbi:hypothetical protein [Cellulomonas fengjieae]|uniref:hypothetical protein n=1 Tax=Cellulomonas fengjieae TaxID=2819978 RepID=UPI001AAE9B00|nr:hypothetical protein [Cellulomonas fengjieae]MBO3101897.1 hypothetical protein [Cellulomonas fengjieae]
MSPDQNASLDERLRRLGIAQDLQRAVAAGIDKLPVSEETKTSLTSKSATAVVVVGETGVALAKGAVTAAKDGAETFQRTRQEYASASAGAEPGTPADSPTDAPGQAAAAAPTDAVGDEVSEEDVTTRLERLSQLHHDGHLTDLEYAEAKARVIAGR